MRERETEREKKGENYDSCKQNDDIKSVNVCLQYKNLISKLLWENKFGSTEMKTKLFRECHNSFSSCITSLKMQQLSLILYHKFENATTLSHPVSQV